jgi:hypothetical protein
MAVGTALLEAAIVDLNRRQAWSLQSHHCWPTLLVPKVFMDKQDLDALSAGYQLLGGSWTVVEASDRRDPRFALTVRVAGKVPRTVVQVWKGRPTRQNTSVLGRIGSIEIVCERIDDAIARTAGTTANKLAIAELARHVAKIGNYSSERVRKLLGRINDGHFVSESSVDCFSIVIGITVAELTFASPHLYQAGLRRSTLLAPAIWAEQWEGQEEYIYGLLTQSRSYCTAYFQILNGPADDGVIGTGTHHILTLVYKAIELSRKLFSDDALCRLKQVSRELQRRGLGAWVSYLPGSPDGDPEGGPRRPRFVVTIDKRDAAHRCVRWRNALPFEKENTTERGN